MTLTVLLLPILYNLLSNLISRSGNDNGVFKMNLNSLNPQTILYNTDPILEEYFRSSVDDAILEQRSVNISEMNQDIWRKSFFISILIFEILLYSFRKTNESSIYIY